MKLSFVALLGLVSTALSDPVKIMPQLAWHTDDLAPPSVWINSLPTPPTHSITRTWGDNVPLACWREARRTHDQHPGPRCQMWNLEVFTITFSDAADPWVVCRCGDADSEANVIAQIARLPPGLRQFVRHFMVFPGNGGGTATGEGDAIMMGPGHSLYTHEAAHVVDLNQRYAGTPEFRAAFMADTCWVSNYAKTSGEREGGDPYVHEIWAETFTLLRWRVEVGAFVAPYESQWTCAQNVFDVVAAQTSAIVAAGYNATYKPPAGPIVNKWTHWEKREITKLASRGATETTCSKYAAK